ncbi:MAG: MBL fold metallo-hydrolase [Aquifex sp.]|nr:MAG: MBL fold metallo-hydrolase [Aquifex sp.]
MIIKVIPVGPIAVNCSVVADQTSGEAVIIDPGAEVEKILENLNDFKVVGIIATHGHIDHVGQVGKLKEIFDVPFYMNPLDNFLINDEIWSGFATYIGAVPCPEPDVPIKEGDEIKVGNLKFKVLHTPGHTPGLCCLYNEENKILIAGDLLFKGSVGRWDLPGGNLEELKKSVKRVLTELPEDTLVICGHYDETTIGQERTFNPFAGELIGE